MGTTYKKLSTSAFFVVELRKKENSKAVYFIRCQRSININSAEYAMFNEIIENSGGKLLKTSRSFAYYVMPTWSFTNKTNALNAFLAVTLAHG